jgi:hypothetical protein
LSLPFGKESEVSSLRIVMESSHRRITFNVNAQDGQLKVALQAGSRRGQTFVPTWGAARDILIHALDKLRCDEAADCRQQTPLPKGEIAQPQKPTS